MEKRHFETGEGAVSDGFSEASKGAVWYRLPRRQIDATNFFKQRYAGMGFLWVSSINKYNHRICCLFLQHLEVIF